MIARCGTALVIALVVAMPLALALCPADTLSDTTSSSAVGTGIGDEVAAALTSLDRDLHGTHLLPRHARCDHAPLITIAPPPSACATACGFDATAPPRLGSRLATPGDACAGPTDLGHPLLS